MNLDMNDTHYTMEELETLYGLEPGYTLSQVLDGERNLYRTLARKSPDLLSAQETISTFLRKTTQRLTPKEEKKTSHVFTVDSMYRSIASKIHDFIYTLPESKRIRTLQIEYIDIPLVWNEFHKAQFFWNDVSVHLPDGTYTPSELETLLYELASIRISIRHRTVIQSSDPFTIDFGKRFKSAGWIMGFRREQYKSTYNVLTSKHELESEARFGYLTECMYVDVYYYHDAFTPDKTYENHTNYVMGYFPAINQQRMQYTFPPRVYPAPFRLERLRIQLFNKFGEPFLNQADFTIHFAIQTV